MSTLQILLPVIAAFIGASAALAGVPLTQWLNRKATQAHWLREQRARVYSDLIASLDKLLRETIRRPFIEWEADDKLIAATDEFDRAISATHLFGDMDICHLLEDAPIDYRRALRDPTVPEDDRWRKASHLLRDIRDKLIPFIRNDLRSAGRM